MGGRAGGRGGGGRGVGVDIESGIRMRRDWAEGKDLERLMC